MQNEKTPCLCTHTVFLKSLSMNVRVKLMDMGDKRRKACGKKSMACQSPNTSACSRCATGWQLIVSRALGRDCHSVVLSKWRVTRRKVSGIVASHTCPYLERVWQIVSLWWRQKCDKEKIRERKKERERSRGREVHVRTPRLEVARKMAVNKRWRKFTSQLKAGSKRALFVQVHL